MAFTLQALHIISAVLLIAVILVQQKSSGLSSAIAGGSDDAVYSVRRGPEKVLHYFTVVMACIFLGTAVGFLFV